MRWIDEFSWLDGMNAWLYAVSASFLTFSGGMQRLLPNAFKLWTRKSKASRHRYFTFGELTYAHAQRRFTYENFRGWLAPPSPVIRITRYEDHYRIIIPCLKTLGILWWPILVKFIEVSQVVIFLLLWIMANNDEYWEHRPWSHLRRNPTRGGG